MKKLLLAIMVWLTAVPGNAQLNQKIIGTPDDETATHIRKLADGSKIIAGITYTVSENMIDQSDIFILRLDPSGNIQWSRRIYGPKNDFLQDMIISAQNEDIILVGNSRPGTIQDDDNVAKIFRLTNAGTLIGSHSFRDNNAGNTAGDMFFGVTELNNGNLVVAGTNNYQGHVSGGLICVYNPSISLLYHEKYNITTHGDEFLGITTDGTDVFITGHVGNNNKHDLRVSRYTPGPSSGTMVYDYRYDFNAGGSYDNNVGMDIYLQSGKLLVNAALSTDCCFGSNSKQAVVRLDPATGLLQDIRVLTTNTHSNTMRMVPITDDRVFFTQNPATAIYDPFMLGVTSSVDGIVGDLTLSTSTQTLTKRFSLPGAQAISDIINSGSLLSMVGTSNGGPASIGGRDIYYVTSAYNLTDDRQECNIEDYTYTIVSPNASRISVMLAPTHVSIQPQEAVDLQQIDMDVQIICGDEIVDPPSGDCPETCYWTLNGNSNVTASHFLGSKNNAELRFRTVNQERGIFDTDGDFGINLQAGSLPDAKLHVFCSNTEQNQQGHSNVRFEELMSGDGDMLVIDHAGYVYRAAWGAAMAKQQEKIANLEAQLAQLQEQINSITNAKSSAASGASFNVYPNPASNEVSVEYNLNNKADNGTIIFTDASGKTVFTQNVHGNMGKVQISIPATVVSGTLICTLLANGETVASQKLSVTKH